MNHIRWYLIVFFVISPLHTNVAGRDGKRPISDQELLRLFKNNESIENRIVHPNAIIEALKWAQDEAKLGHTLPNGGLQIIGSGD